MKFILREGAWYKIRVKFRGDSQQKPQNTRDSDMFYMAGKEELHTLIPIIDIFNESILNSDY